MAVTARFIADFSSFNQAVDRAVQKLGTFEKGTQGVEKSLNRLVDSFSGQKIVREATLAAEAVEAIGGKSKLTQDELQRVATLAQQAAEKLRAMGQDVPPKMQALADSVAKPNAAMSLWHGTILKVGASLAATFSAGAIIAAIKNTGQWAGHIEDLSNKLGISVSAVQRLDFAARQSGSSMDQVGNAIALLSKNLVEGDGAAVPALERLGLSFESLKAMNPDEAFKRVGLAIAELPSDVERLATAQQLLGRSGADLIPMFQNLERDMSRAVVVSDDMIEAGNKLGDSWDSLITSGKALIAVALSPLAPVLETIAQKAAAAAGWFIALKEAQAAMPKVSLGGPQGAATTAGMGLLDLAMAQGGMGELFNTQLKQSTNEAFKNAALGGIAGLPGGGGALRVPGIEGFEKDVARMESAVKKTTSATTHAKSSQDAWNDSILKANEGMTFMIGRFGRDLPEAIEVTAVSIEGRLVPALQQSEAMLAKMMKAMPAALSSQGASQGVGGKGPGIFGAFGGGITSGLQGIMQGLTGGGGISGLMSNLGGGIITGFGQLISGGLASAINAGIGLLSSGVQKLFGKLFGGEGKKVNDLRDQFITAAGGIDVLAKKAMEAGTSVDRLLAAKKVKDFESAVLDLQDTMGNFAAQQEADQMRLQAAIEKYGFTLQELGPALQRQRLDEQATDLAEDWRVLMAAGVDVNAINERMEESTKAYLDAALSVGAEVPASMRPVLQSMLETGQLTDEAGNAFLSLDEAGITFASTLTDVVSKLDELIDKLEEIGGFPAINFGGVPSMPAEGFARGTGGRYLDFGRGTPAMLHGRERIMTEGEGRGELAVVAAVNGLRSELVRTVRQVAMAGRDASLIAAGRTV